jgi:WD40 repeat protein
MSLLFISHSTSDKPFADEIRKRLLDRGYSSHQIFLDSDPESGIRAGAAWEQVLYDRLKNFRGLIVLCSKNWHDSKWCFAELVYAKAMGKDVYPIRIEECATGSVLGEKQAVLLYKEGEEVEGAFDRLCTALEDRHLGPVDDLGWPPADGDLCPFPGLLAFVEKYAGVYFGRERERDELLEQLNLMRGRGEPRLLMVVGGSGSGKSSLMRAGVLPRLKHKIGLTDWMVLPTLRYGQSPNQDLTLLGQLAQEIASRYPERAGPDWKILRDRFESTDTDQAARDFFEATQELAMARLCPGVTTLLAVDQFEELLAREAHPSAGQFLSFLKAVLSRNNGRLLAIGTLRSDYLDVFERHPDFVSPPYSKTYRLGPFPWERVTDVIEKPAARARVEFAPDLVERLKRDAPTADALPLLAFVLEKLFRRHKGDALIGLDDYEGLGGITGAITQAVARIMPDPLPAETENALRLSFVRHLAQVNDKDEVIRRTAHWSDLPESVRPLLDQFVNERLLHKSGHTGGEQVEVSHEALFRCWDKLAGWLRSSVRILRWRRDIDRDRRASGESWSGLSGPQLALARRWPSERPNELSMEEKKWIGRSVRRERVKKGLIIATLAVISTLGVFAWREERLAVKSEGIARIQKSRADDQARIANSRRLAGLSLLESDDHGDRASLLAVEAHRLAPTFEARSALLGALNRPHAIKYILNNNVKILSLSAVSFDADGRIIAAGFDKDRVDLFDLSGRKPELLGIFPVTEGRVETIAFASGGRILAAGFDRIGKSEGGVVLFDVPNRKRLVESSWPIPEGVLRSLAFSPDGRTLAAGFANINNNANGIVLFDVPNRERQPQAVLQIPGRLVGGLDFAKNGQILAVGVSGSHNTIGGVVLFDVPNRKRLTEKPLELSGSEVVGVALAPDGRTLAAATNYGVVLFELPGGKRRPETMMRVVEGLIVGIAFAPDGLTLAARFTKYNTFGAGIVLFEVPKGKRRVEAHLPVVKGYVHSMAFAPDGRTLAVGVSLEGGGVALFDVSGRGPLAEASLSSPEGSITGMSFAPDGRTLAAGFHGDQRGGGVVLFEMSGDSLRATATLRVIGAVSSVAFAPDGRTLAAGFYGHRSRTGGVTLFDLSDGRWLAHPPIVVPEGFVERVAFAPDGLTLAAGLANAKDDGGGVVLFDMSNRKRQTEAPLNINEGHVVGLDFTSDGRTLAVGSSSGVVLLEFPGGRRLTKTSMRVYEGQSRGVAFSPDGRTIAAGYSVPGGGGGVVQFDVVGRTQLAEALPVSEGYVESVAFSPDGRTIAAGFLRAGGVGGVVLFDISSGKRLAKTSMSAPGGEIKSVAFSPDGRTLVSGGRNVSNWQPMTDKDWRLIAGEIARRNLELSEWRSFFPGEPYRPTFLEYPAPSYDDRFKEIARNLSPAEWKKYFDDEPYRRSFPGLGEPKDLPDGEVEIFEEKPVDAARTSGK